MDKRIYLFIPLISVNSVALLFPIAKTSGQKIWFRPPPYVFAIVWPILLLLIGYSWYLRPTLSYYYAFLTLLLSTWSILWAYSKLYSYMKSNKVPNKDESYLFYLYELNSLDSVKDNILKIFIKFNLSIFTICTYA